MNVTASVPVVEWNFFLRQLNFTEGTLTITIGNDERRDGVIVFEHVRSFLFFKESDFFSDLAKYEHVQLIRGKERTVGVYRLIKSSILESVLRGRLDSECPQFFWLSTPDECLEVVGFSDPQLYPCAPT